VPDGSGVSSATHTASKRHAQGCARTDALTSPRFNVRPLVALLVVVAAVVAGCGNAGTDTNGGGTTATDSYDTTTTNTSTDTTTGQGRGDTTTSTESERGCLTADEVQAEIDNVAGGFESSPEEVEAKQRKIREIRARVC
jgi:hypothetical protein